MGRRRIRKRGVVVKEEGTDNYIRIVCAHKGKKKNGKDRKKLSEYKKADIIKSNLARGREKMAENLLDYLGVDYPKRPMMLPPKLRHKADNYLSPEEYRKKYAPPTIESLLN